LPGPDGRTIFTARGLLNSHLKQVREDQKFGYCVPAVRGNLFLAMTPADKTKRGGFSVHVLGHAAPIAKLSDAGHGLTFTLMDHGALGAWNRVHFVPQANLIIVLPDTNDRLVLHKFDVDAALEKSDVDYLFVASPPPPAARTGATFTYPLVVKAKQKGVTYKIESGPTGMAVSTDGVIQWNVPSDFKDASQVVILTIKDGKGQEIFHTLTVRIRK
jgi:hypothetical protein